MEHHYKNLVPIPPIPSGPTPYTQTVAACATTSYLAKPPKPNLHRPVVYTTLRSYDTVVQPAATELHSL